MAMFKSHTRPTPAGWRVAQHAPNQLPHEVVWPADVCHRCHVQGPTFFGSGKAQCATCEEQTVVQEAPPVGLHERRAVLELHS